MSATIAVSRESSVISALPTMVTVIGLYRLVGALFSFVVISFQRAMLGTMSKALGGQENLDQLSGGVASVMEQLQLVFYAHILVTGALGVALLVSRSWLKTRVKHRACVAIVLLAAIPFGTDLLELVSMLVMCAGVWALTRPSIRETFAS